MATALSPSSILRPPSSHCSFISATERSVSAFTPFYFSLNSLNRGVYVALTTPQFVLPGCVAGRGVVGARAGLGVAPVVATVAGADAVPETGAGAGVVAMAGADVVATAGVEGAGEAVADLVAAGGSVDVADSAVDSVEDVGPAAVGSADSGPRCPAGRRTPLRPTAAVRMESQAVTEYNFNSTLRYRILCSRSRAVYIQYSGSSKTERPCPG